MHTKARTKIVTFLMAIPLLFAFSMVHIDAADAKKNAAAKAVRKAGKAQAKATRKAGNAMAKTIKAEAAQDEADEASAAASQLLLNPGS